jgi:RNA polymerase sigma factor (sigma-70 family)
MMARPNAADIPQSGGFHFARSLSTQRPGVEAGSPRERLLTQTQPLVLKIASKFSHRGLPDSELVSAGQRGLVCAIDRFDPRDAVHFSTTASWWIKHAIKTALRSSAAARPFNPSLAS